MHVANACARMTEIAFSSTMLAVQTATPLHHAVMHGSISVASVSLLLLALGACTSTPGETLAPSGVQGQIRDRIYAHARSVDPQCRQQAIVNTEVLELHPGGSVAEERWTLENCRQKRNYIVSFPRTGGAARFQVEPER